MKLTTTLNGGYMNNLLNSMGLAFFILLGSVIIFGIIVLYAYIGLELSGIKRVIAVFSFWFILLTVCIYFN